MTNWVRHGECNKCGHCCEKISRDVLVRTDAQIARDPAFYEARGFKKMQVDGETKHVLWAWLDAPCPELRKDQWMGGWAYSCGIHAHRPQTCQDFPTLPQDIVGTKCSYWFTCDEVAIGGLGSPHPSKVDELVALEGL